MLTIKWTSVFKRDYRKVKSMPDYRNIESMLDPILRVLADENGPPLRAHYQDHQLKGERKGYRDCHVCPDLILIYRKSGNFLYLVRLGSHSEVF